MTGKRLTRRCRGSHCGYTIKGLSSFPLLNGGGRSDRCKSCQDINDTHARQQAREAKARLRTRLKHLNVKERMHRARLLEIEQERGELRSTLERAS